MKPATKAGNMIGSTIRKNVVRSRRRDPGCLLDLDVDLVELADSRLHADGQKRNTQFRARIMIPPVSLSGGR
jgi:hypothetical protein